MKKIFIIFSILLFSFNNTFAISKAELDAIGKDVREQKQKVNNLQKDVNNPYIDRLIREDKSEQLSNEKAKLETAEANYKAAYDAYCIVNSGDCFETEYWGLNVGNFAPGGNFKTGEISGYGIKDRSDSLFVVLIKNLMIVLAFGAVVVMTVGGGYMILNMGKEEMLNKGKKIFTTGIISLVVALSSYYIIQIIVDLIYDT